MLKTDNVIICKQAHKQGGSHALPHNCYYHETGTARVGLLYVSGDSGAAGGKDHSFYVASAENGFYNNEMAVLGRDKNAMINDSAIVQDANNNGEGVIFGSLGYDMPITQKLSGAANLGFAAVAKGNETVVRHINKNSGLTNSSNYLGTEVNAELNYKAHPNVTFGLRGGYVFLGDYFKGTGTGGSNPDNVYDTKIIVTMAF